MYFYYKYNIFIQGVTWRCHMAIFHWKSPSSTSNYFKMFECGIIHCFWNCNEVFSQWNSLSIILINTSDTCGLALGRPVYWLAKTLKRLRPLMNICLSNSNMLYCVQMFTCMATMLNDRDPEILCDLYSVESSV